MADSNRPIIHVVAGLIRHSSKKHKIFFTRRQSGQHLEHLWEFPGGKLEAGEDRFHALRRELQEEVGIDVRSALPLHALTHHYEDKSILLDVWEVLHYRGKPHGREGQESLWLTPQKIPQYPFPDADQPVLSTLQLPSQLLITPELASLDPQQVCAHFSRLLQQRRYRLVLLRSHAMNDQDYHQMALKLREIAFVSGCDLIIHRPALKSLLQKRFDSFKQRHLSADNLMASKKIELDNALSWSASCHDAKQLQQAQRLNCRFALLSTLRETQSHPGQPALGWYQFHYLSQQSGIPLYALGGVQRKDFTLARYQGAIGVAGIGDFWAL